MLSYDLSDEQRLFRDTVREFAEGEIGPVAEELDREGRFPVELVRRAAPARVVGLLLSDVVGDEPTSIASGLTAPDPTTLEDAKKVIQEYGIEPPESVSAHLDAAEETPKPGDGIFEGVINLVVGGGRLSAAQVDAIWAPDWQKNYGAFLGACAIRPDPLAVAQHV